MHAPGAEIIICSDGRVFNDAIGITDENVTLYQAALRKIIKTKSLTTLKTFHLDSIYVNHSFEQMRHRLMEHYGESLAALKNVVRVGKNRELTQQYCGITRFLFEDAMHPHQLQSRTAVQKTCRERAYVVVQRSRAWSALLAEKFPEAVRLSIHPQLCGSTKLGIRKIG
jgi:pyoverdine/dityrosine biosynthesis protein Dit1